METILIIDDEKDMCWSLSNILKAEGFGVLVSPDGEDGIKSVEVSHPDLILLDLKLPGLDGLEVLKEVKKIDADIPVIMLTAYGEIQSAVQSIKAGAFDYVSKPFENEKVILLIKKAFKEKSLTREVEILRQHLGRKLESEDMVGNSEEMRHLRDEIKKVAPTNLAVILEGESGTGKEMIACSIHRNSLRREKPFVPVDCGALPESLVESELFGYEKGAFTGADRKKLGQFELADGGTLFLDEIGNLPLFTQSKFLRVLQEKEIRHLGGKNPIKMDVRIITASNVPLRELVRKGQFRNDLFHRLNEFAMCVPPLRERTGDVELLSRYFLDRANREFSKHVKKISSKALDFLESYAWPGNIRELKNAITRAVLLAEDKILLAHLPPNIKNMKPGHLGGERIHLKRIAERATDPAERKIIMATLKKVKNKKGKAAKILGISRKTLYNKMKKFGLS